jgi:multiple sugar transport system ATP-binding protein
MGLPSHWYWLGFRAVASTLTSLRFDHVWKFFDDSTPAVQDLCLEVSEGEFLVLVGPSGCGKTTSLRMLAGLERPSHGRIWVDEKDISDLAPGERDVAMVFQNYALYPHMSVYRNLAFGPKVRHQPTEETRRRIEEVAAILEVSHLLNRRPSALSGGQRQRVALGRAMVRKPKFFLMDEPLSNLDAALRVQMRAELIRLHAQLEQTATVYVTHDQVEALTMGDRVAVLKDGCLMQVDKPTRLYENPANLFVATFIGSPRMNLVPATLTTVDDQLVVAANEFTITLSAAQRATIKHASGADVIVGIRPIDLYPCHGTPKQGEVQITGRIDVVEHTGIEIFTSIEWNDVRLTARLPRTLEPRRGELINVCFEPSNIYLFDKESGDCLLSWRSAGRDQEETSGTGSAVSADSTAQAPGSASVSSETWAGQL